MFVTVSVARVLWRIKTFDKGQDKLVNTTGKVMAKVQGYPSLNFAVFPYASSEWGSAATEEELKMRAASVAPQVERILTDKA